MNIKTVPNQKIVYTQKPQLLPPFLAVNKTLAAKACSNLSPTAFVIWLTLASNSSGMGWALGSKEYEKWGISNSAYKTAVHQLVEKGYLVQRKGNIYNFYPNLDDCVYDDV